MAAICLCFAIHEPYSLRRYTIFDVGESSVYEDDDRSLSQAMYLAQNCYLPMTEILHRQIERYQGDFRLAISVSGTALDLFEQYTPDVIDNLKALAATGCVEFLSEAGPHSLAFLYSKQEFIYQVGQHNERLAATFGEKPTTFRNSELLFNNDLAQTIGELGFNAVLAEGSKQILGWRSPNFLYHSSVTPKLNMLLRNPQLSADLSQRFSDKSWNQWPLTAEKFTAWCQDLSANADLINIFTDFHAFGLRNPHDSGIFEFMEALPEVVLSASQDQGQDPLTFLTPKQIVENYESKDGLAVPNYISWNDEGSDIRGWLGNEMQKDAIKNLYVLAERVHKLGDDELLLAYERLQTSDYFHYMSTRWFSESQPDRPNPYQSPYDAYISYMNILNDFGQRLLAAEEQKKNSKGAAQEDESTAKLTAQAKKPKERASKTSQSRKKAATEEDKAKAESKGNSSVAKGTRLKKTVIEPHTESLDAKESQGTAENKTETKAKAETKAKTTTKAKSKAKETTDEAKTTSKAKTTTKAKAPSKEAEPKAKKATASKSSSTSKSTAKAAKSEESAPKSKAKTSTSTTARKRSSQAKTSKS
ncbi:MAG: alpha-amylase [Desulfovibrio sp.]|nr:alpha-amylase [Desulfovibrio sp.]